METLVRASRLALAALAVLILAGFPASSGMPTGAAPLVDQDSLSWPDIRKRGVACDVDVNFHKELQVHQVSCKQGIKGAVHTLEDQEYQCMGVHLTIPHEGSEIDIDAGCVLVRVPRNTVGAQQITPDQ